MKRNYIKLIMSIAIGMIATVPFAGCSLDFTADPAPAKTIESAPVATVSTASAQAVTTNDKTTSVVPIATITATTTVKNDTPVITNTATISATSTETPATATVNKYTDTELIALYSNPNPTPEEIAEMNKLDTEFNALMTKSSRTDEEYAEIKKLSIDRGKGKRKAESDVAYAKQLAERTRMKNTWIKEYSVYTIKAYDETVYNTAVKDCYIGRVSGRNYTKEYQQWLINAKPLGGFDVINRVSEDDYMKNYAFTDYSIKAMGASKDDFPCIIKRLTINITSEGIVKVIHHDARDITYFSGYNDGFGIWHRPGADTTGKTILEPTATATIAK